MAIDHDPAILDSALRLAARDGWTAASLGAIAAEANVPLFEVYRRFPSRTAILGALLERGDQAVLKASRPEAGESARDRLFEVIMRRFDALKPHKDGVAAIVRGLGGDPLSAVCLGPRFVRSMQWMLEAAGIESTGWRGLLRAKGLAVIYLAGFRTWLSDESPDSARTMASVDRALRRAEKAVAWCSRVASPRTVQAESTTPQRKARPARRARPRRRRGNR